MSAFLLEANVLIALTVAEHEHHAAARSWVVTADAFAVCPIVEGALIRFLLRLGESMKTANAVLSGVRTHPRCTFWPDSLSYVEADLAFVQGHKQVTDSYLASLARDRRARLVTFDRALAQRHPNDSLLLTSRN